jgi:hypothetical protein
MTKCDTVSGAVEMPPPTSSSLQTGSFDAISGGPQRDGSTEPAPSKRIESIAMNATIRRYEAVDQTRIDELVQKVNDSLVPKLSELPGFNGYYLIEAGNGIVSSVGFFDSDEHAEESTRIAAEWLRAEKLETALPNAPKVTSGNVRVHSTRVPVTA